MLSNPEEFQHLPKVDDDEPMAEPAAPAARGPQETQLPVEMLPAEPPPGVPPAAEPPPPPARRIIRPVEMPQAPEAESGRTMLVPRAAAPAPSPEPSPEPAPTPPAAEVQSAPSSSGPPEKVKLTHHSIAKTPAADKRQPTTRVPVVSPAPAAASSTEQEGKKEAATPPPPPSEPAKKDKATKRIPLPEAPKDAPDEHSEEYAAHLEALKAAAKIQAEAAEAEAPPKEPWRERWEKMGGRSLAISVGAHLLLLIIAALTVFHHITDKQIDFLPGGGSVQGQQAEQALQHKIQQKKNPWLKQSMPVRKIAVASSMNNIVLPTTIDMPDVVDLPQSSKTMGGGALSAGFGLAGAGGGFGNGVGLGAKSGMVFGPLFGLNIKARKLAVVLDVSSSMTPHLGRVVKEVDKVAKGSVVVLYFGCGLEPPIKQLAGTKVFRTSSTEFEKFWRLGGATFMETANFKIDKKDPIPQQDLFLQLSRRQQTYFIHNVGVGYAWLALLSDEVRNADGLYWFSDFQDSVDFKQIGVVLENLKRRKQRLYIHSYGKGQYFDLVKNQLVVPTAGDSYIEE